MEEEGGGGNNFFDTFIFQSSHHVAYLRHIRTQPRASRPIITARENPGDGGPVSTGTGAGFTDTQTKTHRLNRVGQRLCLSKTHHHKHRGSGKS